MATGTFYLRPSGDVEKSDFSVYPSTLEHHYLAINEEECDDSSTYISYDINDDGYGYETSVTFDFDGNIPDALLRILSASITLCGMGGSSNGTTGYAWVDFIIYVENDSLTISGADISESGFEEIFVESETLASLVNKYLKENNKFPSITVKLDISGSAGSSKGSERYQIFISQLFMTFSYSTNIGIYKKERDQYKATTVAYKKQGGTWTETSEDECKTIIQNNTIRRG